jgi:hypothetical protein
VSRKANAKFYDTNQNCTISLATCNKLFEILTPFNWEKIIPRLTIKAAKKTFSWPLDTRVAVTCMNRQSFKMAFEHYKPRKISEPQSCVKASGDKTSSLVVFKVDLQIKGKRFTHPVNVINKLNEPPTSINL